MGHYYIRQTHLFEFQIFKVRGLYLWWKGVSISMKLMYTTDAFLDEKAVLFRVKIMYLNHVLVTH